MKTIKQIVQELATCFPSGNFQYGDYLSKPSVPFGLYYRIDMKRYRADDETQMIRYQYLIRVADQKKNPELEQMVETILERSGCYWEFMDEAEERVEKIWACQYVVETWDFMNGKG